MATVVDRIRALGLDSSFGGRKKLYQEYNLGTDFSGTADQNLRLASEAERRKSAGNPAPAGAPAPAQPTQPSFAEALAKSVGARSAPQLALAESEATEERGVAESGAKRLREAIARSYQNRFQDDPLAKQGIVSGAQEQYLSGERFREERDVESDLTTKLSQIARRLSAQRGGITAETEAQVRQETRQGSDQVAKLYENPELIRSLPNPILKQILESYGYTVTN